MNLRYIYIQHWIFFSYLFLKYNSYYINFISYSVFRFLFAVCYAKRFFVQEGFFIEWGAACYRLADVCLQQIFLLRGYGFIALSPFFSQRCLVFSFQTIYFPKSKLLTSLGATLFPYFFRSFFESALEFWQFLALYHTSFFL